MYENDENAPSLTKRKSSIEIIRSNYYQIKKLRARNLNLEQVKI